MKKIVLGSLLALVIVVGAGIGYLAMAGPKMRPAPDVRVEVTPERIARGKYLFENLSDCEGCHSPRDISKFGMPVVAEERGSGFEFPPELGLPGRIVSSNITPDRETGIGNWTDGEKIRAIREGVSKDGRPLFAFMPYGHFRRMSDEDVHSLVAYLDTIPPVKRQPPLTELAFPANLINKFEPAPLEEPVAEPDRRDKVKYGEYLVNLGICLICHTRLDKGKPLTGVEFAGGEEFRIGPYLVRSANITPDEETGIGKWDEARFVAKFRGYANLTPENAPAATQANFTVMPWFGLAHLEEDDLKAIYAYLRTPKPIYNPVEIHPPVAN